jgi:ubiquinone/menaquinone biosynthesis C-methylase UbiE
MTTSDASKTRPKGRESAGIILRAFRLNAAVNHLMFTGRRGRVYDRIVALSGVRPGDSVLDVGSSNGYLAARLAAAGPAIRVTGVDPSEPAIAYARRHARPGTTFTVGVAQDLRWPDASFDVVTCTLAMHHIPRRQRSAALAEMYRVTKPGGRLLAADLAPVLPMRDRLTGSHPAAPGDARRDPAGADPAWTDPLGDLAAAGFQIESFGKLPLLHYIVAVRPQSSHG